jgi:hypothetical protein
MNALTSETIIHVCSQVHPNLICHPTSIAYIQSLLKPYAEAIEVATDIDGITQWIPLAFPGELSKHATAEMIKAVAKLEIAEDENNDPKAVSAAKVATIEYLVAEILELSGNRTREILDSTIFPWDIQTSAALDEELSKVLGITTDQTQLPVTVTVGPQQFTHMLSEEFTLGLLLFSDPTVGNHNFNITMFGAPLPSSYMVPTLETEENRLPRLLIPNGETDIDTRYTVDVGVHKYGFDSPDFMQGFSTGALWAGVDHHKYWKNLFLISVSPTGEPIDQAITF